MRRVLTILMTLFCSLGISNAFAQEEYNQLVVDGKTWKGMELGISPDKQFICDLFLSGDTTINGKEYLKCYIIQERGAQGNVVPKYSRALREEDRKVYGIGIGSDKEYLLYDFNVQVGDSLCCGVNESGEPIITEGKLDEEQEERVQLIVLKEIEDYTSSEGVDLRCYHFTMLTRERMADGSVIEQEGQSNIWAEGVGSINDYPLNSWHMEYVSSFGYWLQQCYDNQHILYVSSPSNIQAISVMKSTSGNLYDLQGRRLQHTPAKGVYIQDGKKYIK